MILLSVHDALERILSSFTPVTSGMLPLAKASGRILAADISAGLDLPSFDNSTMDGFAVISTDVNNASQDSPQMLPVIIDIPAGSHNSLPIQTGQAARIMTGAPLPRGADAVVPVEDTDFNERSPGTPAPQHVTIYKPVQPGDNIRLRGTDVRSDQQVLSAGQRLRPQDLGLLAMLGVVEVPVFRRPCVALFSSGDELISVTDQLTPGKVRDANVYTLSALIEDSSAEVVPLGIAADDRSAVQSLLDQAVDQRADLIISSAGVSVGAFDFVKDVVESHGTLDFWKVNMRPGKPLAFGNYRRIPFIGLPGNPVSAFIGFEVFVRPAIQKLSGVTLQPPRRVRVRLDEPVKSDGRESYLRAIVSEGNGALIARLTGHQDSGNFLSLVQANALLIIPPGVKSLATGEAVDAWLLPTLSPLPIKGYNQ